VFEALGASEHRWAETRSGAIHRAFDTACAACGLILLSPVFVAIAALIKLDDAGPIFYKQPRIGRRFQPFQVFKFRTMTPGADGKGLLTACGDARVTRVGRRLRAYKLDELPQLINVFRGEMQLVGSRPEVARYVERFHGQYALLLQGRPGITDPATLAFRHEDQILSGDGIEEQYLASVLPEKLRLSLEYQQRRTFLSDILVLLQTVLGLAA
jgi:lipopolysaccharide/colanic/teichoic acid biosynthesis glycosyltransferase